MRKIITLTIVILLFFTGLINGQHFKKDGTPDMRYKENKTNYSFGTSTYNTPRRTTYEIPSANTLHLKKDGTPDKRYKANKINNHTSTRVYSSPSSNYNSSAHRTHTSKYHRNSSYTHSFSNRKYHTYKTPVYSYGTQRDHNGKIKRSESAKRAFMKQTGYPHGRPGYVIDHIKPLKRGGCDCPGNMQWQSIQAAKEKDKWE